jgi:predicted O-methyltransferase YrrM
MKRHQELSMESSFLQKSWFGLVKAITSPRLSLSWLVRGHLARDGVFVSQTYWFRGALPRLSLAEILPQVEEVELVVPRAFDRKTGISATVEEACHLAAIARRTHPRKVLEIGTYDGNTALLLAANTTGSVVTVDLPPDFSLSDQSTLAYADVELNLTHRSHLGRQYKSHELSRRIRQVYGDSAQIDWSALGGPFDLIFIDGCHAESYVRSDSRNALEHLAPGGVIVWHDYGMSGDVSRVVDEIAGSTPTMKIFAIEGTRLAVGLTQARR